MAYGEESWINLPMTGTGNSVQSTDWLLLGYAAKTGTNGEVFAEYAITYPRVKLKRLQLLVTEVFAATGAVIKAFKNGTSGTLLATFTMGTTAADKVVYLDVADTLFDAGDYIAWELTTKPNSTGTVMPSVLVEPVPETAANISDMTTTGAA